MSSPYRDNALSEFNEKNSLLHEIEELTCYFYTHDGGDKYQATKIFIDDMRLSIVNNSTPNQRLSVFGSSARYQLQSYLTDSHTKYGGYLFDDCFIVYNSLKSIKIVSKKSKQLLILKGE